MSTTTLIFPHQLFKKHPALVPKQRVYLIEEYLFFKHYGFHKIKLVLHRASMKAYAQYLQSLGYEVTYIDSKEKTSDIRQLIQQLGKEGVKKISFARVADEWLDRRIIASAAKSNIELVEKETPYFLNNLKDTNAFFAKKKTYFQSAFYVEQRKQRNILLTASGEPEGGQWSFDADNRERYPKQAKPPAIKKVLPSQFVEEAKAYVDKNFPDNYGETASFLYPVTFEDAALWLQDFIKHRFKDFGIYEDAIVKDETFLNHSVLSPLINIGLLEPQQVVSATINNAAKYNVPLNSLEGFLRQIIGWREFIQLVYLREGNVQRTKNYWGFKRKIPESFWKGTTGIVPIDTTIKKILETGYCHHIERLMVLGNFMLLCEFDPDDVHKWFMEMFVDSYDWVMVPNVYGMTQFADGGLMTTKPYISGSNYIIKMSDYKKEGWATIWDGLFWRFMHEHRQFFLKNPRLGMLVHTFDKMSEEKQQGHLKAAEDYMATLDGAAFPVALKSKL